MLRSPAPSQGRPRARPVLYRIHGQDERSGFPAANLRHHLAPRRGQDHAHREAPALRRRDPAGRRGQGARRGAARPLGLDEGRAGARHLRHLLGDDLRVRRLHLQPARHPRPRGLQRGHLPHPDRRRLGRDGDRRRQGDRGADPQAVRGLPAAQRPDRHLHQQARPRGARSLRPDERDRAGPPAPRHPGHLADRHGAGFPRRLRPPPRTPGADGPLAPRRGPRRRGGRGARRSQARRSSCRATPWSGCARRSRWRAASARRSTSSRTARGI